MSTTLRRGTLAVALPALLLAGTTTANAAEPTANTAAPAGNAAQGAEGSSISDALKLSSDGDLSGVLTNGDLSALLELGSSILGADRPDFSEQLDNNAETTEPSANTDGVESNSTETNNEAALPTGVNALKRVAAQEEQKAGHKLFDLVVTDATHVHVHFAETYNLQEDAPSLAKLGDAAKANGITLTADR
ncbi:hypothetical protein [Corynebacterium sp.]|uniref:hypothetical protein n=1 Tax=Corynebacterium sp. TaxID=1720 RepID=UPI0026DD6990|nr:hypothetical protein [Corynebacterium sp.]MDO5031292.1 hypothetical protein [Corynebacterium sp.]